MGFVGRQLPNVENHWSRILRCCFSRSRNDWSGPVVGSQCFLVFATPSKQRFAAQLKLGKLYKLHAKAPKLKASTAESMPKTTFSNNKLTKTNRMNCNSKCFSKKKKKIVQVRGNKVLHTSYCQYKAFCLSQFCLRQ